MSQVHGKDAYVSLDDNDLSAYCNSLAPKRSADSHDTTTFGAKAHRYKGGLLDGTFDLEGIYEDGTGGPKAIIEPMLGQNVAIVYRPEGIGTGLPEQSGDCVVTAYEETTPVADMITWKATVQLSGDFVTTEQA